MAECSGQTPTHFQLISKSELRATTARVRALEELLQLIDSFIKGSAQLAPATGLTLSESMTALKEELAFVQNFYFQLTGRYYTQAE